MASPPSPPPTQSSARSHRSASHSSSSSLHLDPATQALLASFLTGEAEREQQFRALEDAAHPASLDATDEQPPMDVDSFRRLFQEDWQISQFWYSTPFASTLSAFVHSHLPSPAARVAFVCCPTGFVAFQHAYPERREANRLMEFDRRFALLAGRSFVGYDLDEPEVFPEELRGTVEVAVVDPPFMNEVTNTKLAKTLEKILHPTKGRLILLTSTSVAECLPEIYGQKPLGPLYKTSLKVGHSNNLGNDYACWTSWEGAERGE